MGSAPYNGIDGSVGALVWVRRRNGSWWPGRILSRDDLPEGCMPAPRSGSPVKLLGREDASVDWYNIEKSKRVKAFRCGEYDDCIEKAKAFLSKKSVKYARREDAILDALKLENISLGIHYTSTRHNTQEESQHLHSEENNVNQDLVGILEDDFDSAPEHSESVVSFEEPKSYLKSKRRRSANDLEDDDGAKSVQKHMKGLQDLGTCVDFKRRKRSQDHKFLKKKNRTLPNVLECTPMVCVPVVCEQFSGLTGLESNKININNNSDSTNGFSCENGEDGLKGKDNEISNVMGVCEDGGSCERLFDVPIVNEECKGVSHSSQSSHLETLSLGHEERNKTISTDSGPSDIHNINRVPEKGTSEWQLKGKRNSRLRKIDIYDDAETYADIHSNRDGGPLLIPDDNGFLKSSIKETQTEEFQSWNWNNYYLRHHTSNNGDGVVTFLRDVSVEVQMSYHVPYISLMSKLNRKPVVGHPLSVEVMEDGYLGSECCIERVYKDHCHLGRLSKRKLCRHPPSNRRSNGLLSKKIRKLSSLAGPQRQTQKLVLDSLMGPSMACIPLKVIFSRINTTLNSMVP